MHVTEKKVAILKSFLDSNVTLIETGTHLGYTSSNCSPFCKAVHTCEINMGFANRAENAFKNCPNVTLHKESSYDTLQKIASGEIATSAPYVFWLDAHMGNNAEEEKQKILVKELNIIKDQFKKENIRALLIDDSCGLKLASELLTVQECYDLLLEINPNFRISSILRGGHYNGPTIYDADVLMAYDADLFDMTIKFRE
jgi:hypothetical protein